MKLSISLSTLLLVLPALVTASIYPLDTRNGDIYMPRNHARQFGRQGRQRQGGFRQGQGRQGQQGGGRQGQANQQNNTGASTSVAAAASASATQVGGLASSTGSCPAPTTVTVTASAAANTGAANQNKGGNNNNGGNNGNNNNNNNGAAASSSVAASASASASTTASAADVSGTVAANNGQGNNQGNNNNDPNTSLTLLSNLVATNLANNGQDPPVAGQVASLTTTNNFINYCAGKTITNGQQITTGSCNPVPLGDIIPKAKMPRCKFASPANGDTIPANTAFTIKMNIQNMQAGVFTNAQKTYYMAPQQLNGQGVVIGHTHFTVQKMGAFDDPSILDAATFAFFKGVNTAAVNGQLTADVTAGLPAGNYRLASINTDANHAPAVAAVAQHGFLDDMVYFTVQ